MPNCCRCNVSGRCKNCICVKSGTPCISCCPRKNGRCSNLAPAADSLHSKTMNDPQEDTDSENTDLRDSPDSSEVYTPSSFLKELHQESSPQNTITNTVHSGNTLPPKDVQGPLPPYPLSTNSNLVFGDLSGEQLTSTITRSYELIVHWKPNVFLVPSGRQGKRFVDELTRLFNAFNTDFSLQPVAIEAAMLLPALMLQKPLGKLKTRELVQILKRRLDQWDSGDIPGLLEEGKLIQNQLERITRKSNRDDKLAHTFAKLITSGRTRSALQLLSKQSQQEGVHKLDTILDGKSIREILHSKHPNVQPADSNILLEPPNEFDKQIPSIIFKGVNTDDIRHAALNTQGAAGPSGLDAACWRRLCTAFGQHSNDLCSTLTTFAKKIATSYVNPRHLSTYTACRLIPLDKCPGVRPIGIAEVCRRIVGKVLMKYTKPDLQQAVGPLQLCAGFASGCEGTFHAMKAIIEENETEGMIFVDASNTFNKINQEATLFNCQTICPTLAPILINTHREPPSLFVDGEHIQSSEGTTQGDPLGLAMYAIGIQPLVKTLTGIAKQAWYADDSAAGSTIANLKNWWDQISLLGPKYGYHPNSSNTKLLVKSQFVDLARVIFEGSGIEVHSESEEYLGGAIGSSNFIEEYLKRKLKTWANELSTLIKIAQTEPHAAYAAYTHGLMSQWNYTMRIIDIKPHEAEEIFSPLERLIRFNLFPALTSQSPPNQSMCDIIALPTGWTQLTKSCHLLLQPI